MMFHFSSYFLFVCTGCALALPRNFESQLKESNDTVVLSQIISNYIRRYLSNESIFISLIHASSDRNLLDFHEHLTTNLFHNPNLTHFSYYIGIDLISRRILRRRAFNVILIDDTNLLKGTVNENTVLDFHLNERFIIIVTVEVVRNNTNRLNDVFKILWQNNLINANVLIQDQPQLWTLYTFMPYQKDCFNFAEIRIDSFTPRNYTKNLTASTDELFPEKLSDFNQCPLTIAAAYQDPFVTAIKGPGGKIELDGIDIEMVKQISKLLNFKVVYTNLTRGDHGAVYPNKSITANLLLVHNHTAEFVVGGYVLSEARVEFFSPTNSYTQASIGFCFLDMEAYSPFTRLMAPFQSPIWITIGLMILVSMVVILLTKLLTRRWRHFYIGGRINRTPILNMWNSVLGLSVANPRILSGENFSNFARTLSLLWTVLWLVIRSAHQGALYEYLQANRSSSAYDTVEKIRAANCNALITPETYFVTAELIDESRILVGSSNYGKNILVLHEPSQTINCLVALSTDLSHRSYNLKSPPDRRLAFTKNRLLMHSPVIFFRKKSMLIPIFNTQMQMIQEAGLINFWTKNRIDDRKSNSNAREPTKLQMENVTAAFQICGFMCFISLVVFILEVISVKYQWIKSIIDYLTY